MSTVGIVDFGMGNLRSVQKGLEKVGVSAEICTEARAFERYDGLVLPGVGAFGDAMRNLESLNMIEPLLEYISLGRRLLGICLGMQLLFSFSEEHGRFAGLDVIPGSVARLPEAVKVPHMGWNVIELVRESPLFEKIENGTRFYFVHSYYCSPDRQEWVVGRTPYGVEFASAVGKDNVWGVQFHPEKSSSTGLRILGNFGRMVSGSRR